MTKEQSFHTQQRHSSQDVLPVHGKKVDLMSKVVEDRVHIDYRRVGPLEAGRKHKCRRKVLHPSKGPSMVFC